ncbi:MAG: hypothetical protein V4631_23700 [Pseudomonadota bacterium]
MILQPPTLRHERRLIGLAVTLALHLALFGVWRLSQVNVMYALSDDTQRIQWVKVAPPRPVKKPVPVLARASAQPKPAARVHVPAAPPPPRSVAPEPEAITQPVAETPRTRSVDEMMQQARKDIGKIDKDLRKEFPGAAIKAPPDSPQIRLEKGIEHAAEMAPPKWYEAPKITELVDPGGYGRKRYRVITANGTYCVTYESNHAPDGIDSMQRGIKPKITTCPQHEEPAPKQKWEK